MSGNPLALDTNEAIAVMNDSGGAASRISAYSPVYLPVTVVGELLFGAMNSHRSDENCQRVLRMVGECIIIDADLQTAETYARVRRKLKQRGRPIPENDVWIAALCLQNGLSLATADRHFADVEGLSLVRL